MVSCLAMGAAPQSLPHELERFLAALSGRDVRFVVCGGVACILHGVKRVTADLDIAVHMENRNLLRLVEAARELGLRPRVPEPLEALLDEGKRRQWQEVKQAKVFTLIAPDGVLHIDVFLDYPIAYDELEADAQVVSAGRASFRVSSREHLIAAKQCVDPPRKEDLRDIQDLQELIEREKAGQ
jgi:hypothetical protein